MTTVLSGEALVARADWLAERYHAGQVDKSGVPYINHPRAVAASFTDPFLRAAALLHDTVEDGKATAEGLEADGMPLRVIELVLILTRDKESETYGDYIDRVCLTIDAARIKLRDLLHNTDPTREFVLPPNLARRYHKALVKVVSALEASAF